MTTSVTFNGTTYSIPASGETGWSSLSAFLIDVAGNAQTLAAQKGAIRVAISSPITISTTDYTVLSNLSIAGPVAFTLPIGVDKTIYVIGDTKGDAQTNNITITPNSGTINGAATYVIANNFGVVALQYSTAAAEWKVIGRYFTKINAATEVFGLLGPANGGTGVANNAASTLTITGSYALGLTLTGITSVTLPTTGTLATTSNKLSAFAATTSAELAGVISDETGSGALVFGTSPTLITPTLGVATATSINKMAITAPASGSTLAVADGKTFTASNTLTLSGTDGSTAAFGAGGTVAYVGDKLSAFAATTSAELAGVISDETGSGALMFGTSPTVTTALLMGAAAETRYYNAGGTFYVGFKGGNAAANKIWTLPLVDGSANQLLSTDGFGTLGWATGLSSSLNQYNVSVGDSTNTVASTNTSLLGDVVASIVSGTATMTIATPCVVTKNSHGITLGKKLYFTTTGALPTGVSASTTYYCIPIDANTFNIATTYANAIAGTKIASSGSQSGTHTLVNGGFNQVQTQGAVKAATGSAVTLLVTDDDNIIFSPSASHNVVLPTTGVLSGRRFKIYNNTSYAASTMYLLTLVASGGTSLTKGNGCNLTGIFGNGYCEVMALQDTPTTPAHWRIIDVYEEGNYSGLNLSSASGLSAFTTGADTSNLGLGYVRKGNLVTVSGVVDIDATTANTVYSGQIDTPTIASLTSYRQAGGGWVGTDTISASANDYGSVTGTSGGSNKVAIKGVNDTASNTGCAINFQYRIQT